MNLGMKKENHNQHTGKKTKKGRIAKNRRPRQYYSVSRNLNVPCGRHSHLTSERSEGHEKVI